MKHPTQTNDEIRDLILRHLYDVHRGGRGRRSNAVTITDLQKALRPLGPKQQDVSHNLDYLVQKEWVREVVEQRSFTTPRGMRQSSERVTYKISDVGIDRLEAASTFQRQESAGTINITNVQGVTVVGDGNIVSTTFTELSRTLADARQIVLTQAGLPEATKLDIVADIDTLQGQLQKPTPNREIVAGVWQALEKTLKAAGLVELGVKIAELMRPLLG